MTVAAIIVNYRTAELTVDCVRSLLASEGVALSAIVVDNASGDGSAEHFRRAFAGEPRVRVIETERNGGYTGGNNAGFAEAARMGAEHVFVLNSDTTVDPACVRLLLEELERSSDVAVVSPRIFYGDPRDRLWFGGSRFSLWHGRAVHVGRKRDASAGLPDRQDIPFATGCAFLARLEVVQQLGGFDESLFAYGEDLDFSLKVQRAGYRIRYVPDAVLWHLEGYSHRKSGGQALRIYLHTRNMLRVLARHARWWHWFGIAPVFAVDTVLRFVVVSIRDGDYRGIGAVWRGMRDAGRPDASP